MASHSWEAEHRVRDWPLPDRVLTGENSDEESDDEYLQATGEEAGHYFVHALLEQHFQGKMSAKQLCTLCWWASRAGARGPAAQNAFNPAAQTGHFQRHVDTVTGIGLERAKGGKYYLDVPGHHKHDASRTSHSMPVQCPREALHEEVANGPSILARLEETLELNEWEDAYWQHPIVQSHEKVLPVALYVDGVPVTNNDGFVGFFVYNLITNKRHLVAILRKSNMCKFGCRGWCSIYPILEWLHWSFTAMAEGTFPTRGHNGVVFGESDGVRFNLAGMPLGYVACALQIKCDWMECVTTFGFASWQSLLYPCPFCRATIEDMYTLVGGVSRVLALADDDA